MTETIRLRAGTSSLGEAVYEELLVERLGSDTFELLRSPGLLLGAAAGDTLRTGGARDFEVVRRGGNLCVQVFCRFGVDRIEDYANRTLGQIRGHLDGKSPQQLVFTIPVNAGFAVIEDALNRIAERFPGTEWYYGNVYDPADGVTPLNWWKHA